MIPFIIGLLVGGCFGFLIGGVIGMEVDKDE